MFSSSRSRKLCANIVMQLALKKKKKNSTFWLKLHILLPDRRMIDFICGGSNKGWILLK